LFNVVRNFIEDAQTLEMNRLINAYATTKPVKTSTLEEWTDVAVGIFEAVMKNRIHSFDPLPLFTNVTIAQWRASSTSPAFPYQPSEASNALSFHVANKI